MKITKQRLKEIIKEELKLGDLQTEPKFTGGTPEERMNTLINARERLAGLSEEEMTQLADGLDEETLSALKKLLDNPMATPSASSHRNNPFDFRGLEEDSTTKEVWVKLKKDFVAGKEGQGNWLKFAHLSGLIVGKRRSGRGEDQFVYDIKWTLEDGTVLYSKNFQTELERV